MNPTSVFRTGQSTASSFIRLSIFGLTPFNFNLPLSSIIPISRSSTFASLVNLIDLSTCLIGTKYLTPVSSLIHLTTIQNSYKILFPVSAQTISSLEHEQYVQL